MKTHAEEDKHRAEHLTFLHNFISSHKLAAMATVTSAAKPQVAIIGIAVTKDMEIICGTFASSRKYQNILTNPQVALAIGWGQGKTVQYEGIAEELSEEETKEQLRSTLAATPTLAKYVEKEFEVVYKIKPKWVRYIDLSKEPWDFIEVTF